jgi:hypothetical protein
LVSSAVDITIFIHSPYEGVDITLNDTLLYGISLSDALASNITISNALLYGISLSDALANNITIGDVGLYIITLTETRRF